MIKPSTLKKWEEKYPGVTLREFVLGKSRKKLKPDVKEKWLKALRSRGYRQTNGVLRRKFLNEDRPRYCCLGVLCNVMGYEWEPMSLSRYKVDNLYGALSETILKDVNMHDSHQWALINLNDLVGFTFREIADVIETYL